MKKLLLAVALLGGVFGANAQEDFAPKAGTFSTEIQFNPFSHDGVFQNGGVFSGAYFCTDKFAVMFDLGLGGTNDKEVNAWYQNDKVAAYTKEYNGTFQLSLGAIYYFYNYKRVNLYAGAKVSYFHNFAGFKDVTDVEDDEWTWSNEGTSNGFGVYALTGINFNIYKGLYLGAELNVGFKDDIAAGYTTKARYAGKETEQKYKAGGHNLEGGFNVNPTFILGWNF